MNFFQETRGREALKIELDQDVGRAEPKMSIITLKRLWYPERDDTQGFPSKVY